MPSAAEFWSRVTAAFGEIADLADEPRAAALAALAREDPAVHAEVTSLLHAAATAGDRFEHAPVIPALAPEDDLTRPGRRVGPYVIVREIGRGGMGAVWEAHRADDQYQKRVAIKMIPQGLDTERMVQRFLQERNVLARLEHKNIAVLLDGGITPEGQPWFAMEYVEGEPIDRWCARRRLGVRERVALFRQVCGATQYAHEHLVIHRDLKPGNILVRDDGTVKLLDFGVARLADPSEDDAAAAATATAPAPFTASYASPEQFRGARVTTASDIYSLGVVLFELLTARRLFTSTSLDPGSRTAPAPSRSLTAAAARELGGESLRRAMQALRGDLDSIVLMALRPEPDRRYRSAQQLDDDLARALDGRPVLARPDTIGYRAATFVRRNRAATALATLALAAMIGGTAFSVRQAALARAERDRAVLETARTKQVTQFFQDVLSTPKPDQSGRDITVVEALDVVIPRIDSTFAGSPDLRAAIKNTLGSTLHDMGLYDRARPLVEDALRLRDSLDQGRPSRERADALYNLAGIENELGESARAESLYVTSLTMYGQLSPPADSVEIYRGMNNLATAIHAQGRLAEAAELYGRIAAWLGVHAPALRDPRLVAIVNQGTALAELGRYADAEPRLRDAVALNESIHGTSSSQVAIALQPLAGTLLFLGRYPEAEQAARRAWAIDRATLGDTNATTLAAARMLVNILADADRCAEAIPLADSIIALRGHPLPESDLSLATAYMYAGWCRGHTGDVVRGEREAREALALRQGTFPADHWAVAQAESVLGDVLAQAGPSRRAEAERLLRAGYQGLAAKLDSSHVRVRQARERLERLVGAPVR